MNQQVYERTTNPLPWVNKGMVISKKFGYRFRHNYNEVGIYDMSVFEGEEL